MSFELRITITGLSLFVARPADNPPTMHVFLPECRPRHPQHFPRAWYDGAHQNPPAQPPAGQVRLPKDLAAVVDFSTLPVVGGSVEHLPASVPCISCTTGQSFNVTSMSNVASHLKLPPGSPTIVLATSVWNWHGKAQHLAGAVVWSITVNAIQLPAIPPLPALNPINGVIDLFVSNATQAESTFPPPGIAGIAKPALNSPMAHFDCYYDLYNPPYTGATPPPAPLYQSNVAASTPYSCLSSGGH
jgi:hypothetical protein